MGSMYSFGANGLETVMDEDRNITSCVADQAHHVQGGQIVASVDIEQEDSSPSVTVQPVLGFEI